MLDLTIFHNRLFAAASAAAFLNGLSRFALMFLFVFYFQGPQGDDADHGRHRSSRRWRSACSIASPLAGIWADRRGSRALAAVGMLVSAVGLAGMTMLQADTPYWLERALARDRRHRLGHVQQPEHGRDDGRRADRTAAASPRARE